MTKNITKDKKFLDSIFALKEAFQYKDKAIKEWFYFAGISKCYEVCLEYAWKYFKRRAIDEGYEVFSPKDAIRYAGKMHLIDNVEKWIDFLDDRNLAVHDYLGLSNEDYLRIINDFYSEVNKLVDKIQS